MAGSDFSIDFAAAAPQIYDHDTGGGAFEDKTINVDAVESLEGGDFAVGDIVSYYFNVVVAPDAVDRDPQTIEIDVSFLVNTTGQTGVSHRDIVGVSANYYTGELNTNGDVNIIADTAIIDDDSTTAWIVPSTEIYENKVRGEEYADYNTAAANQGAVVSASVRLNDLEPGEEVVLRVDTLLDALAGSSPTGNLQGYVTGARVISPTDDPVINVGNQTIPFKLTDEISGIPELAPNLTLEKAVTTDLTAIGSILTGLTDLNDDGTIDERDYYEKHDNEEVTVQSGTTVRYLYEINNTGNAPLADFLLVDDLTSATVFVNDNRNKIDASNPDDTYIADIGLNLSGNDKGIGYITGAGLLYGGFKDSTVGTNGINDFNNVDDGATSFDDRTVIIYYDVAITSATTETITNSATAIGYATSVSGNNESTLEKSVISQDTANVNVISTTDTVLSGYSYLDLNNDGIFDQDESGIVGVTIKLYDDGVLVDTTQTDMNGFYIFEGITAGNNYTLEQTQPSHYYDGQESIGTNNGGAGGGGTGGDTATTSTISSVDIQAGNYYSDYNFGELLPADISGVAYIDLNTDGNRQDTETGRAGIEVTLSGNNDLGDAVSETTTTDSSGRYYFGSLRPSDGTGYTITFTGDGEVGSGDVGSILGITEGDNPTGTTNTIESINLGAGDSGVNYDFGVTPTTVGGVISGTVYQDTGIYNPTLTGTDDGLITDTDADSFSTTPSTGEKRIAGVTIELYDLSDTSAPIATTTTDINGNYSFTNLPDGNYEVREIQPQYYDPSANNGEGGFVNYLDGKEAKNNDPNSSDVSDNTITNLAISGGNSLISNNFGELPPASISGYVFLDLLRTKDVGINPGESLLDSDSSTIIQDINGNDVTVGTGNNDQFTVFTVDVRNGEFDDDEFGLAGIEIQLSGTDDEGSPVSETTTTDANGYYRFDGLRPSNGTGYTVTQVQPSDYDDGIYNFDADLDFSRTEVLPGNILGTQEGLYNDPGYTVNTAEDNFSSINLNFGQSGVDYNFPEATSSGLITGTVYADVDNDDVGDSPLSGVTIELLDDLGTTVIDTTTTNANGYYAFTNVTAGLTYQIRQTDLGGYESVKDEDSIDDDGDGTDDGTDGNANADPNSNNNDNLLSVTITSGEIDSGNDFIDELKNTITGTGASETLTGTSGNDVLIGGAGQDTLDGNAGNDCFQFNYTSDGIDTIQNFTSGEDKIDFSSFFVTGGELEGITNPFGNLDPLLNYVETISVSGGTMIQIDFDPSDSLPNKNVVFLEGYTTAMTAADFVF